MIQRWDGEQDLYPNVGVSVITRNSLPQATAPNVDFTYGPFMGQPRPYLPGPQQDPSLYKPNPSSPATGYAPQPLFNNQIPATAIVPYNTPAYCSPALARSYSHAASLSKYGCGGSASNFDAVSIANTITSDGTPPTPVYLTEPRGVHIGNVPFKATEAELRRLVARRLQIGDAQILNVNLPTNASGKQKGYALVCFKTRAMAEYARDHLDGVIFRKNRLRVKTDQDRQTLYPVQLSTADYGVNALNYCFQPQHRQTTSHQSGPWSPPNPVTSATYDNDPGEYAEIPSSVNPEPETTTPAVVNGSKSRRVGKSPIQGEEQSRAGQSSNEAMNGSSVDRRRSSKVRGDSKSKKICGDDSKGETEAEQTLNTDRYRAWTHIILSLLVNDWVVVGHNLEASYFGLSSEGVGHLVMDEIKISHLLVGGNKSTVGRNQFTYGINNFLII